MNSPQPSKFYREVVTVNKAQCLLCGQIIESTHVHDFRTCKCGNLSVDGGHDYIRRAYREDRLLEFTMGHPAGEKTWVELSESHQEEREPYEWEIKK